MRKQWTLGDSARRRARARREAAARRPSLRPFFAALRELGFTLDFDSRGGGTRTVQWKKTVGDRLVEVQLWPDPKFGGHRATHSIDGRMCTLPTDFRTVESMRAAIAHELARTDHPPRRPPPDAHDDALAAALRDPGMRPPLSRPRRHRGR